MKKVRILVTGGCGYIGSHTVVELIRNGYDVVIVDDFSNSKPVVLDRIKEITGKSVTFYEGDVCNKDILRKIFHENKIDAVIHFAGYKAVGESVEKPLMYFRNNIDSTLSLLEVMTEFNVKKLVFSSSATVYGNPRSLPIKEDSNLSVTNPYGRTKLYIEGILNDVYVSDNSWSIAILRYFNPVGADSTYLIGEEPNGIPNNLMPYIVKVATGELDHLNVFGNDYNTHDGTGARDYIHVTDLALGHIKALLYIDKQPVLDYFNLGRGECFTVLDMVSSFEKYNNVKIPYQIKDRRKGDIDSCYADVSYAKEKLGWEAYLGLEEMVTSSYKYAVNEKNRV